MKLERMTKQSRLRRLAKRALPARLRAHRQAQEQQAIEAKRPREPRLIQRDKRQAARAAHQEKLAKLRPHVAAKFGLPAA